MKHSFLRFIIYINIYIKWCSGVVEDRIKVKTREREKERKREREKREKEREKERKREREKERKEWNGERPGPLATSKAARKRRKN